VIDEAGIGQLVDCPKCGEQMEVPCETRPSSSPPLPEPQPTSIPPTPVKMQRYRMMTAVGVLVIGVAVVLYKGFQVKMMGDQVFDKVGLSSGGFYESWRAGMGFRDFSDLIVLPKKDLIHTLDQNLESLKWNLNHPDSKRPEISIDHVTAEHKRRVQDELKNLYGVGRETTTQAAILGVLFLITALFIWPRRSK
jgi:hypothetical protein